MYQESWQQRLQLSQKRLPVTCAFPDWAAFQFRSQAIGALRLWQEKCSSLLWATNEAKLAWMKECRPARVPGGIDSWINDHDCRSRRHSLFLSHVLDRGVMRLHCSMYLLSELVMPAQRTALERRDYLPRRSQRFFLMSFWSPLCHFFFFFIYSVSLYAMLLQMKNKRASFVSLRVSVR